METRVQLQEMFSYSTVPIFIVLGTMVLIVLCILICILVKKIKGKNKKQKPSKPVVAEQKSVNITKTKQKYLNQLLEIEAAYQRGDCSVRKAYQRMSAIIRGFVQELTGIKVQNCTLQDIMSLQMPVLEDLIKEYYSPEFAQKSEGDVKRSIDRTRGAIERWN